MKSERGTVNESNRSLFIVPRPDFILFFYV